MKGAVATGHHLTSQAALDILDAGGNAIDAAIAAFAMACIAEPCMASMAGGGFAMIYWEGQSHVLDFFCQTPMKKVFKARLDPIPVDFGTAQEQYYSGIGSVAVPGAAKGLFALHQRWGKMPLKELFAPAIHACRQGVVLTPFQSLDLHLLHSVFSKEPRGRQIFTHQGKMKTAGEVIKMDDLADFLFVLAHEGEDLVYRGEVARSIHALSQHMGGHITYEDMSSYEVQWRAPQYLRYKDHLVGVPPAPSMGHALLETFLSVWPTFHGSLMSDVHLHQLLDCATQFRNLLTDQERLFERSGLTFSRQKKWTGTSHFNILDKDRNAISLTFSIGEGSGIFLDGTDMHLNNMLGEPSLLPNGLESWAENTRLASMMTPMMVFDKDGLRCMMGTGGAERIASILAQTLIYYIDMGLSMEKAVEAPRTYLSSQHFEVEPDFEEVLYPDHYRVWKEKSMYFGGVHAIQVSPEVLAVGDVRREGHAVVL